MLTTAKRDVDDIPAQRRSTMAGTNFKTAGVSKTWTSSTVIGTKAMRRSWARARHAAWLGSMVFDGARAFEGVAPDLDLHCTRVNNSAKSFLLKPTVSVDAWLGLVADGRKRFDKHAELYIRPMYWAENRCPRRRASRSGLDPLVPVHL